MANKSLNTRQKMVFRSPVAGPAPLRGNPKHPRGKTKPGRRVPAASPADGSRK